jgi:Putative holin
LTSAMMVGVAVGLVAGVASTVLITARVRPDVTVGLVVGVPAVIGMLLIVSSRRRWVTALGVFLVAMVPGWFGVLVAIEGATGV